MNPHRNGYRHVLNALDAVIKAHVSQRRAPKGGLVSQVTGRTYRGGQWLDAATWEHERRVAAEALPSLLREFDANLQFLRQVYEQQVALERQGITRVKKIPLSTVEARLKAAIRDTYAHAFRLGKRAAGNLTSVTPEEQKAIMRLRRDEYQYLRNFLSDIRTQSGVMPYERRMSMYAAAVRELYWLGWVLGDRTPGRMITWHWSPEKEHCKDCAEYAQHGPYSVEAFIREVLGKGHLPQSGALECLGFYCGCYLTESRLPEPRRPKPPKGAVVIAWKPPVEQKPLPKPSIKQKTESREKEKGRGAKPAERRQPVRARSIDRELIAVLNLPPIAWIRLNKARIRTVGQLRRMSDAELAEIKLKPEEIALIRGALRRLEGGAE